jgi:predicted anti-sigma-YlaC factor YlaD
MLTCKNTSRLISEGQERQLGLKERIKLRLHVWMCSNCRHFEQQIVTMQKIMRDEWKQEILPANKQLPSEAQERIRKILKTEIEQSNN